jgi:predicted nucleotide-binding protein
MNNKILTENVLKIIWDCNNLLNKYNNDYFKSNHELIIENAEKIHRAFCGSWIGYHSSVYYKDFEMPPAGAFWDKEWGPDHFGHTEGDWVEYRRDIIVKESMLDVDEHYEEKIRELSTEADTVFEENHDTLLAIVDTLLLENETNPLIRLKDKISKIPGRIPMREYANALGASGQHMTRDQRALSAGAQIAVPQHITVQAFELSSVSIFESLQELVTCCNRIFKYMELNEMIEHSNAIENRIFIGHGRSSVWRDLKDFLTDRLHLNHEEFNRITPAGIHTTERLQEMLSRSSFAFLVLTAEDQDAEGMLHARQNVIHEVGLFQGKLGFRKAIVLLEDGCEEFSNIHGLGQIRFPSNNISAKFEEIRQVLEREGII